MNVTLVELISNQALFDRVYFAGTKFYITGLFKNGSDTRSKAEVYSKDGDRLGIIFEHWFDFGNKKVFKAVEEKS